MQYGRCPLLPGLALCSCLFGAILCWRYTRLQHLQNKPTLLSLDTALTLTLALDCRPLSADDAPLWLTTVNCGLLCIHLRILPYVMRRDNWLEALNLTTLAGQRAAGSQSSRQHIGLSRRAAVPHVRATRIARVLPAGRQVSRAHPSMVRGRTAAAASPVAEMTLEQAHRRARTAH